MLVDSSGDFVRFLNKSYFYRNRYALHGGTRPSFRQPVAVTTSLVVSFSAFRIGAIERQDQLGEAGGVGGPVTTATTVEPGGIRLVPTSVKMPYIIFAT